MSVFPKELANPPMTDLLESNTNNIFTIFSVTSNIQPPPYELFTILFSNNLLVTTVTTIPSVNLQDKYNLKKLFFKFTPPPFTCAVATITSLRGTDFKYPWDQISVRSSRHKPNQLLKGTYSINRLSLSLIKHGYDWEFSIFFRSHFLASTDFFVSMNAAFWRFNQDDGKRLYE